VVDLEAEFSPSLLNTAVYLLQLIQQISTFAVNYQGRPFRESISENKGMFWGIIGVTAIAFSCSTKFIPELNEKMMLVDFSNEFSTTLTIVMVLDYLGCYVIEVALKWMFSDFRPRDIALRRPEQEERERERKAKQDAIKAAKEEEARLIKVAEFEKKVEERRKKIQEWADGKKQPVRAPATAGAAP
jgi:manganese-transporting P-type ATPase